MAKVRVIKRYNDMILKNIQEEGTILEVSKGRAEHLVNEGMAELIETQKHEEANGKDE